MEVFTVYIISNTQGILYKGYSSNLAIRLAQHNSNLGKYTSSRGPWQLVFSVEFETKRDALIEEKRIKKLNKKSLDKLIGTMPVISS